MQCPKARSITLQPGDLEPGLPGQHCPETGGVWIERNPYDQWCADHPPEDLSPEDLSQRLANLDFSPAPEDSKAALCPHSGKILIRARVDAPQPFYIERSPETGGFWLDRGEWTILKQLGLHNQLDRLFSADWKAQLREQSQVDRQRTATIEKLGQPLAQKVFELADELRQHPNGDFGVSYLTQVVINTQG